MMDIKTITEILNKSEISDYVLSVNEKLSRELFYVAKNLELNRAVDTRSVSVEVFVDHDSYRGSSMVVVTAADDEESFTGKLNEAVAKAGKISNPWFPIAEKCESVVEESNVKEDLNVVAARVAEAVFRADKRKRVWLSATEIFVSETRRELFTSKGNHHVHSSFDIFCEIIPTVRLNGNESEVYKQIRRGDLNYRAITKEVKETMDNALLRARAKRITEVEIPADVPVVVESEMIELIIRNLAENLSYQSAYHHMNHYEKNRQIADTDLNLTLCGSIRGVSSSCGFDDYGTKLTRKTIIRNGKAVSKHGDLRYAHYLKRKATGEFNVASLSGEIEDISCVKHILIKNFSAPQLESSSGYFGGEVRLALYFDGERYIPLTSFSIAGNIYKDIRSVRVSKEQTVSSHYRGPKQMIFRGISIY